MLTPLLLPIFILILGALLLPLLNLIPRMRGLGIVATATAGSALGALLWLRSALPIKQVVSAWSPLALFGAPLTFEANASSHALATVLVTVTGLSLLACCLSEEKIRLTNATLMLGSTGAGVAALFASSFVALVVTWGITDILLTLALSRYGPKGVRRAGLTLFSGILATSALWAAPLLNQAQGISGFLNLAHFSGPSASLLQMAVILRLGLVPLHLWRPIDLETKLAQLVPLAIIPTLLGFDLLTYLPALTAGLPSTLFALAGATVLVGGFVAWSETDERLSIANVLVAETGLAVLAVANTGQQAIAVVIASAIAWALSTTIFALTPGWNRQYFWRGLPALLALFSLTGLPATLGFVVRFTAYSGLGADLLALAIALLGESFVIAALIRLWLWAEPRPLPARRPLEALYLLIFGLSALTLILFGLSPQLFTGRGQDTMLPSLTELMRQGGVAGWAGWALPLVAGVTLFLAGEGLRQRLEASWRGLGTLLRLEWVYGLFYIIMHQGARLVRGTASVVEGEGALLWTAVFLLLILLYITGNGM